MNDIGRTFQCNVDALYFFIQLLPCCLRVSISSFPVTSPVLLTSHACCVRCSTPTGPLASRVTHLEVDSAPDGGPLAYRCACSSAIGSNGL